MPKLTMNTIRSFEFRRHSSSPLFARMMPTCQDSAGISEMAPRPAMLWWVLALACLLSFPWNAPAELPAPDNFLYGTITLGSQLVTAANTNIVVEARTSLAGPAISSYRMGTAAAAGNFYVLKVILEELAPAVSPV